MQADLFKLHTNYRDVAAIARIRIPPAFWASKTFPEIAADALVPLHRETGTSNLGSIDKLPYIGRFVVILERITCTLSPAQS